MKLTKIVEDLYQQMTGQTDDHEVEMAITDLRATAKMAAELAQHLQNEKPKELEGWVQAKITKAADYMEAVYKNHMYSPDQECNTCGDMKEAMEPKLAYGDRVYTNIDLLKGAAKKITNKPENYTVLSNQSGDKLLLTTNQRAVEFAKNGWMKVGKIDPNGEYRETPGAMNEVASTCCGRCGHFHVKGTSCPKPFLTGKRHCRNRPK